MTNAGRINGISRPSKGGLDVKPYGLFSSQASPGRENAGLEGVLEQAIGGRETMRGLNTVRKMVAN